LAADSAACFPADAVAACVVDVVVFAETGRVVSYLSGRCPGTDGRKVL